MFSPQPNDRSHVGASLLAKTAARDDGWSRASSLLQSIGLVIGAMYLPIFELAGSVR
jgi:hypothetical protein